MHSEDGVGPSPSYEDVLVETFLPLAQRSPALAAHVHRLVYAHVTADPGRHDALDHLLALIVDELRRLERTLSKESRKCVLALTPACLLSRLPLRFLAMPPAFAPVTDKLRAPAAADADGGAPSADQLAPGESSPTRKPSSAARPSGAHRAAWPPRRSRADVIAQYGEPSEWQMAGRGSSKVACALPPPLCGCRTYTTRSAGDRLTCRTA
ncbi:hypothetical protein T492DRAFT_278604 [Pavlovales sp. CCMP2436]|nr:hypothetical protein T492DRAFT_278604 [Pavlovales sp. CCMP2436]